MYIYLITNLINNKKYVGQTIKNPSVRWRQHNNESKVPKYVIHFAMRKHSIDNFQFEVIDESAFNLDELNDLEEFYVSFYDTFKGHGYNSTSGGEHYLMSEEAKQKISDVNKGNTYWLGRKHSEETKKKMSENMKGKYVGKLNGFYGKTHTEETIKLLSDSHKTENLSKETRQKMSDSQRNRKDISKKVAQCDLVGNMITKFLSVEDAHRITKITASNISRVCNNIRKTAGGFIWRYM